MKIVHMSDLHITEYGREIWETDTKTHFDKAIEYISKLNDIDAIIVTGDISDDGSEWSYNYVSKVFEQFAIPVICCPGNHDKKEKMNLLTSCHLEELVELGDWKILNLDSTLPEMARGGFDAKTMRYIESELSRDNKPTIIAFHHPSLEPGGWLNRKLLEGRELFNDYISNKASVKLILYGHTHYPIMHNVGSKIFSSAPSIGFAFDKDLPKFQIANGKEGFNIIEIEKCDIQIHTVHLNNTLLQNK